MRMILAGLAATTVLAACERENPTLYNVRSNDRTPDEFAILPTQPLQPPPDFTTLPPPTPGGANRTDPRPRDAAIAALGGRAGGGGGADGALLSTVARYGVQEDIRGTLAAEDLDFRRRNDGRLLERLFNVNVYTRAYAPQSLDQHAELERLRRAGIRTVAAPPDPELDR